MSFELLSYPQVVYKQATAPTSVNSGALWLDTDDNNLYYYNGTSWILLSISLGDLNTPILENTLGILEIQAADTITSGTSALMIRDIFSDSGGYLNTIDTGNSTAQFITNLYKNDAYTDTDENTPTATTASNDTGTSGYKITMKANAYLHSITKHASDTSTNGELWVLPANTLVAEAAFAGNVATFATPQLLTNGVSYYVGGDGGSRDITYTGSPSYPYVGTLFDTVSGWRQGADYASQKRTLTKLTFRATTQANKLIQTNEQTLSFTPSNFQVFAYKDATTGTGTITADVSFDSGAHYQTGIALDTATAITNSGTGLIVKINLNAGASAGASECKGYGVMFW